MHGVVRKVQSPIEGEGPSPVRIRGRHRAGDRARPGDPPAVREIGPPVDRSGRSAHMEDTAVADRNTVDVIPALGDEGVGAADRGGINGARGLEIEAAVRCRGPVELSDQSVAGGDDGDAEGLDAEVREIRAGHEERDAAAAVRPDGIAARDRIGAGQEGCPRIVLLPAGDVAVPVRDDRAPDAETSVAVLALDKEDIVSVEQAVRAGRHDGDRGRVLDAAVLRRGRCDRHRTRRRGCGEDRPLPARRSGRIERPPAPPGGAAGPVDARFDRIAADARRQAHRLVDGQYRRRVDDIDRRDSTRRNCCTP